MSELICNRCKHPKDRHQFQPFQAKRADEGHVVYCRSCMAEMQGREMGKKMNLLPSRRKLRSLDHWVDKQLSVKEAAKKAEIKRLIELRKKRLGGDAA